MIDTVAAAPHGTQGTTRRRDNRKVMHKDYANIEGMEWNAIAKADTVPYLVGLVCCSVAVGDRGAV